MRALEKGNKEEDLHILTISSVPPLTVTSHAPPHLTLATTLWSRSAMNPTALTHEKTEAERSKDDVLRSL